MIIVFVVIDFSVGKKGMSVFLVLCYMLGYEVIWVEEKFGLNVFDIC